VVYGIDHQWQADLVDLAKLSSYNKGFKYLLTCIDVLSRYQWVVPLTDKKGKTFFSVCEILPHLGFQCSVKTFNDTGFVFLVVSGKEVHVVFFEKL
jgi:hypothetical protein